jgi:Tfp pilus assembly protein PilP
MKNARPILALTVVAAAGLALAGGSVRAAAPASPADPAAAGHAAPVAASGAASDNKPNDGKAAVQQAGETINRILDDSEAVLAGRGFTYDPAGRRDPFRSLIDPLNSPTRGPRPRGISGMLISEVDLVGIVQKGQQAVAFFNGSDNKGYFLKVGDALYDGKIIRIDRETGTVMFRQDVNDPRSIKPFRDVTKRLASEGEEAK